MHSEHLVYAPDPGAAKDEVIAVGGRLRHVLTPQLLVVALPDGVSAGSLRDASIAEPQQLQGRERLLAEAWTSQFGAVSRPAERLVRAAAAPPIAWDTPGYTPPDGMPGRDGSASSTATPTPSRLLSTDTSTSVTLTGSVAVGVVMVSGPPDPPSWTPIHGALKYVSVSAGGTVWGVNAGDEIFGWNAGSGIWDPKPGRLKQVSVGNVSTVWGVNSANKIYRWNGAGWDQIPGALKHVSVADDGSVWGVNPGDKIYRWNGSRWEQVTGRLKQISVSSASLVWGVNSADQIYTRGGPGLGLEFSAAEKALMMAEVLQGLAFLAAADPAANVSFVYDWQEVTVDVAPGAGDSYEDFEAPWRNAALGAMGYTKSRQGSVDYVNALRRSRQTDWAYVAYFTKYPLQHFGYASGERLVMDYANDGWGPSQINQVFAHETCHIFGAADEYGDCGCGDSGHFDIPNNNCVNCTSAQVSCLMNANTLALCPWSRGQLGWSPWEQIAGALKYVSVASDGTVWGVNAGDEIYRWNGSSWEQVPGSLKQVSVGNASTVWGVNSVDRIFIRTGDSWTRVSGALKHVTAANDGTVWGVNAEDEIYVRSGSGWNQMPGRLKQISAGNASTVWGVNSENEIYRWNGNGWTQVSGALKHVSVADDGSVWGVNADDKIYRWNGSSWEQVPGALKQVSAGATNLVWGVNSNDGIFRRR